VPAPQAAIVVALAQYPTSLDPADHRSRTSETVIRNLFDGLVTRDTRDQVHLELAQEITWLDDRTLRVVLREGVLFHDGVEMTAADVAFSFQRILDENAIEYPEPHSSPRQSLLAPLASVEQIDDYAVLLHLNGPWPSALQMLVHQQIVPQHYLESEGTAAFAAHPIGTGPFRFVSAEPRLETVVLERFDGYYGGAPGLPPVGPACVERVTFRVIPDATLRAAALAIGEVDLIQGVDQGSVAALERNPGVQVKTAPGTQPKWMEMNVQRAPFDDVRVRRALNYALDKGALIDEVYGGRALALLGPMSPLDSYANQELAPYPYDPERALALLSEAGWADTDYDGILDKEGRPFSFVIDTLHEWLPLARAVAGQLQAIGIQASVRTWEKSIIEPQLLAGERLAYLDDWGASPGTPAGYLDAKWHSHNVEGPFGSGNYSGYSNPKVDELMRLGRSADELAVGRALYAQVQRILYQDAPAAFLVVPEEIEAASTDIRNWEPASDSRINLHDVCAER
jgi:peptide/nickel transport system substrate-binding protein